MAYQLTLQDLEEEKRQPSNGYQLTLADLQEPPAPPPEPTHMFQPLINIAGGAVQGAEQFVAGLENIPRDVGLLGQYFGVPGVRQLARLPAVRAMPAPWVQQQALTTRIPSAAVQALGILGTGGAGQIGRAGEITSRIGRRALLGMPGVKTVLGKNALNTTENLVRNLSGGESLATVHTPIVNELKSDFTTHGQLSANNYNNLSDAARSSGYVDNPLGIQTTTGVPLTPGAKSINFENTNKFITALQKSHTRKFRDLGDILNEDMQDVTSNPSFSNAHNLQMELGNAGSTLKSSRENVDRALGKVYFKARRNIINDIKNSFVKNNDSSLSDLYTKASDFHLNNVIPYTSNSTLRRIVTRTGMEELDPENIHTILKKGEEGVKVARENLSPQSRKQLVLSALKPAFKGGEITPKALIDRYRDFDKLGFGHLRTNELDNITDKIARQQQLTKWTRLGLGGVGALELGKQFGITPGLLKEIF